MSDGVVQALVGEVVGFDFLGEPVEGLVVDDSYGYTVEFVNKEGCDDSDRSNRT
jgi:hypothetical protein